jgi:hypothetical protein
LARQKTGQLIAVLCLFSNKIIPKHFNTAPLAQAKSAIGMKLKATVARAVRAGV